MELTKEELYYLSDIAWWLKGYVSAKGSSDINDFSEKHVEVLTKVINESTSL